MGRRDPVSRNEKVNQLITEKPNSLTTEDRGTVLYKDRRTVPLSSRDAIGILCGKCRCRHVQEIGSWDGARKADAIKTGYANGISIRQLSRITGVSKAVIERVLKEF